jgi:hypothetical protein
MGHAPHEINELRANYGVTPQLMVQLRQCPESEACGVAYMRVLVIEDQPQIAAAIESGLRDQEMDVDVASTASGGEAKASIVVNEKYRVLNFIPFTLLQ